ncbi:agmatine deiminase family protein [Roseovarius rhodophyticola]|uniref:Agmatine deiminase family protein n=1 Tax=Roseovarius rhodophyticola TaxID=3080827 RepID=A0ABZ2TC20_9RHOB|nr:agmatine deiminase family protein [Roseovarius sp. W115]MDV2930912.1 agmatine deiminase family protein [Roseovarius sp. W115]
MKRRTLLQGMAAGLGFGGTISSAQSKTFFVPAEEAPHECTFMQWPVSRKVYSHSGFLKLVQAKIAEVANLIAEFEPVVMLADAEHHAQIAPLLSGNVTLWNIPTEDLWCRDSGPIFAIDGAGNRVIQHIKFNGWGNKQTHAHDSQIAPRVAELLNLPLLDTSLKGEGGGIEQDGHGLLMAHESSWVIRNRNPGRSREDVENALLQAFGASKMIWAPGLKDYDITDYHIDALARFTGPGGVLMNLPPEPLPDDPFYNAMIETYDVLIARGLDVDVIPEPNRRRVKSYDFVASYVNYYVCNGAVITSEFGDAETDAKARQALMAHFPEREIVMMNADILGELGGGIHCATQQMPRA